MTSTQTGDGVVLIERTRAHYSLSGAAEGGGASGAKEQLQFLKHLLASQCIKQWFVLCIWLIRSQQT
jgi:hypothetical protein